MPFKSLDGISLEGMLFVGIRLVIVILVIFLIYILINIITTLWLRFQNPLVKSLGEGKTIYLTFDDGMDPKHTPLLLDLLKTYGIKATFFVMAQTIESNTDILKRMKEEGHIIGLHSWSHKNSILQNPFGIASDFCRCVNVFYKHNLIPLYYRPPWGHVSLLLLYQCKLHGLKMVFWNVIVQDWEKKTTPRILCEKLEKKVKGNAVVCLHDGRGKEDAPQKTIKALYEVVPKWIEEGYKFETMDQWYKKNSN